MMGDSGDYLDPFFVDYCKIIQFFIAYYCTIFHILQKKTHLKMRDLTIENIIKVAESKGYSYEAYTTYTDRFGQIEPRVTMIGISVEHGIWHWWEVITTSKYNEDYTDVIGYETSELFYLQRYNQKNGYKMRSWRQKQKIEGIILDGLSEILESEAQTEEFEFISFDQLDEGMTIQSQMTPDRSVWNKADKVYKVIKKTKKQVVLWNEEWSEEHTVHVSVVNNGHFKVVQEEEEDLFAEQTESISKSENWRGDVYSYSISKNSKTDKWSVDEYLNGDFNTDFTCESRDDAIIKMINLLAVGETGVFIKASDIKVMGQDPTKEDVLDPVVEDKEEEIVQEKSLKQRLKDGEKIFFNNEAHQISIGNDDIRQAEVWYHTEERMRSWMNGWKIWFNGAMICNVRTWEAFNKRLNKLIQDWNLVEGPEL